MHPAKALHTAARRYCVDRSARLHRQAILERWRHRERQSTSVLDHFWALGTLHGCLRRLEQWTPREQDSVEAVRARILTLSDVPTPAPTAPPGMIARAALEQERFCRYVQQLAVEMLPAIEPLGFCRPLSLAKSRRVRAEMFLPRGFAFTHETVRDWEARFAPLLADQLRVKRKGQAGRSWYVDETYVKIAGRWWYLYRAIDRDGNLVDVRLNEHRDMDGAKRFFEQAVETVGHAPDRVTTDGHDSYPRAIRETLGDDVMHRCSPYLNNRLEQDHRGIKQRYYPNARLSEIRRCLPLLPGL